MVWYASEQASIIANLRNCLCFNAENSASERINLQRDVQQNAENIDELLDIIDLEERGEETSDEVFSEIDEIWDEFDNVVGYFNELVKLQSRIAI